MYQILQLLSSYVKPLIAGGIGFLGWFLVKRNNTLKVENELINQQLKHVERKVEIQDKVLQVEDSNKPLEFSAILERMRNNKI